MVPSLGGMLGGSGLSNSSAAMSGSGDASGRASTGNKNFTIGNPNAAYLNSNGALYFAVAAVVVVYLLKK